MLAYCFLTEVNPLFPDIWERWLAGAEGRVCVHTKVAGSTEGLFASCEIPEITPTAWGHISLVRAQLLLLKYAFQVEGVTKAVFLSGSCVPLVPRQRVEKTLLSDSNSWFMHPHPTSTNNIRRRRRLQADYGKWIKSSQWCCITKADWNAVFHEDRTDPWKEMSCPDEHYFIMECEKYDRPITYGKITWSDWVAMESHPLPLKMLPVQASDATGYMFARKTTSETEILPAYLAEIGL